MKLNRYGIAALASTVVLAGGGGVAYAAGCPGMGSSGAAGSTGTPTTTTTTTTGTTTTAATTQAVRHGHRLHNVRHSGRM